MSPKNEKDLLWKPSAQDLHASNMRHFMNWLASERNLRFGNYHELWEWSVDNISEFWQSIWDYFNVNASIEHNAVLEDTHMPGTEWFTGARLNYAENFFSRMETGKPAIISVGEDHAPSVLSWYEIRDQVTRLAASLRAIGVDKGDTIVAYMPNIPETIIALFAVASIGAIWSSCSPDFGLTSVLDRFQQIKPKVLLTVDGYQYNGKTYNRMEIVSQLQEGLPSLEKTVVISMLKPQTRLIELTNAISWSDFLAQADVNQILTFEQVAFDHPLWVLYSSGTTGLPKPIVHSHGGILLEHLKMIILHLDLGSDDRFFWYTSTGWMMWNFLVSGLLSGATIVLYDGSPGYPTLDVLWRLCQELGITYFGTSAAFIHSCMKAGIQPNEKFRLETIKAIGSTGSPLSEEGFRWVYANINEKLALESVSGGTDLCTAFVGGCRLLPIYAGEIQCAALGARVQAFDAEGTSVTGQVGELVITKPMPSMPIYFWGEENDDLYRSSYFDTYPGIWRHGDWIKFNERGGSIIYGRSDSTINRQGIRMGTSEIYRAVESFPEVEDSLVADLELLGRESYMILFIVLSDSNELEEDLAAEINKKIKTDISPRHVPDEIRVVEAVPYTLSGKKLEVPVRKILLGQPPDASINKGAMRNPESIQYFIDLAETVGKSSKR